MISFLAARRAGAHTVLGVAGELDVATAASLRDRALALVNQGVASLVIDLRGVTFVDSTGVGSLLRIYHRQGLMGGRMHVVADQQFVVKVLDLLGLSRRLHVAPSVSDIGECCLGSPPITSVSLDEQPVRTRR